MEEEESYDGEEGSESEESEEEPEIEKQEPKVYEIQEDNTENVHDLINIQINQQHQDGSKITAVQSSLSDATEAMGTLMSNRT